MKRKYLAKYRNGELVYEEEDGVVKVDLLGDTTAAPFYVMGDIQPYKSMVTGEMIEGRRQHREHLKEHRLIEVGNEKQEFRRPEMDRNRLRQDVVHAVKRVLG